MGVFAGPDVKENGLVLALDAANNKSYSRNRFLCPGTIGEGASADNNVSFSLNGTGTFVRMGYGQTVGGYTIKPTDVVYKYVMGGTGCFYHGNKITVPQGSYLNFSFDYLVTGATTYPITNYLANIEDYSGGGLGNNTIAPNSTQGIWQRRVMQSGPAATTVADCNVLLYPGACNNPNGGLADSGTIYYRNPRAEIINYDPDPNSIGSDSGFSYSNNINLATDISGNNNNGTFTGTEYAPLYSSGNGGSWIFDGNNDYISCGTFFNYTNFTISLWAYPGSTQVQYADIFDNNHTGTQNFVCQQNSTNTNQYSFGCINATNASGTSLFTLTENTWHHLTFTWNNSVASAYINGVFHSSGAAANPINYVSPNLSIARWSGGGRNWNGRIGNFAAYNRVLTAAEIQQNFNSTKSRYGL